MTVWGSRQTGTFRYLGSYKEGTIPDEPMKVGEVYEYYAETNIGWGLDLMTSTILGLQTTFQGLEVLYYNVNEQTGIVNFQFWYPPTAQNLEMARAMVIPAVYAVIAVIAVLIVAFIVLDKLGIVKTGMGIIIDLLPGMVVTVVGGAVTGILPGKAKVAGIVPIGVGLWLMLGALGGVQPQPPVPSDCDQYTSQTDCEAAGCYWWSDGTCHAVQEQPPVYTAGISNVVVS